jgi:hypothetical protein
MNIIKVLSDYNIPFLTEGKNVKDGNVNVQCPWCGSEDKSMHMGINLETGMWGCWRSSEHRGRDIRYLIIKLINCSIVEAEYLLDIRNNILNEEDLMQLFNASFSTTKDNKVKKYGGQDTLVLPVNFHWPQGLFTKYLSYRGFEDLTFFVEKYKIYSCLFGDWRYRLIFPIYFRSKLVTWIGRSIATNPYLPYMDLSIEESVRHSKYCLYNFDNLVGGDILFITEGIFDALKLDYYSPDRVNATCIFTKTMRNEQAYLLYEIAPKYKKLVLMLDTDAQQEAFKIVQDLGFISNILLGTLPLNVKDPGELSEKGVKTLVKGVFNDY